MRPSAFVKIWRLTVVLPVFLALAGVGLSATRLGAYLDETLFHHPYLRLRDRLGLGPAVDPRLKLILVDDRSLARLKRRPDFGDWQAVARTLFALGYERVLLPDTPALPAELGEPAARDPGGALILGAVTYPDSGNPRATLPAGLPQGLLVAPPADGVAAAISGLEDAAALIVPAPAALARADALASVNTAANDFLPLGYRLANGAFLPGMGLMAVGGLRWQDGGLVNALGPLPRPVGGHLYLDIVSPAALNAASLPASAFFGDDGLVAAAPRPALADKLRGGKVALLVPDAFTGGRFFDSPIGKVPAFVAMASLLNGNLAGRYVYVPMHHGLVLALWLLPLCALLLRRRPLTAQLAGLGTTAAAAAASVVLLVRSGYYLPTAEIALTGAAGCALRAARDLLASWREAVRLGAELELGKAVQKLLLPAATQGEAAGWEFSVAFEPYGEMSGDWYQTFPAAERGVVAIGDVVGKGPSAALNTATIAGLWGLSAAGWRAGGAVDGSAFAGMLSRTMHDVFHGEQNSTMSLAVLGPGTAALVASGAPAWVLWRRGDKPARVRLSPGNPLGMAPGDVDPAHAEVAAGAGDILIAYTDGVIDGSVGMRRFLAELPRVDRAAELPALAAAVAAAARAAGSGTTLPDDFTMIILRHR